MTPEEKQEFDTMKTQLAELRDQFYKGDFADNRVFSKKITSQEQLIAEKYGVLIRSKANPTGFELRTGTANTGPTITAEIGVRPHGTIYISTDTAVPLWIMVGATWTQMIVP